VVSTDTPFFTEERKKYAKAFCRDQQQGKPRAIYAIEFGHGPYPTQSSLI